MVRKLTPAIKKLCRTHKFCPTSQYCSLDYQNELKKDGFICSMSHKGNSYDNSPMESFWGKLKQEWLNCKRSRTRKQAISAIWWYIEVYYKNYRLHMATKLPNSLQQPQTKKQYLIFI